MKTLFILILLFMFSAAPQAQVTTITPVCTGVAATDTSRVQLLITAIGANEGTIQVPYKASAARCALNTITFPANITLDNTKGSGFSVTTGQTVTIAGHFVAPIRQLFYNALAGQGTVVFSGNHSLNTLYSEWWGAKADNSTDCFAAIQAAQTALKTLKAGTLQFNTGPYLTSQAIQITEVKNQTWQGTGRVDCVIKSTGTEAAVQGNGVWFSKFIGLAFQSSNALTNKAPFELDGNYDGTHTQGVQGNTFIDCTFDGSGSTYAFTLVRRGGSAAQGSENLWLNCHWLRATDSCYYHSGYNAHANQIIGGDFQSYQKNGISYGGGTVHVYGTSFESTYGYTQVLNDGYDINTQNFGVYENSIIQGCRTESLRFFRGNSAQSAELTGITYYPGSVSTWAATTSFALNAHLFKIAPNGSVNFYRVTTSGVSGGTEPTWPNSGTVVDGGVTWTLTELRVVYLAGGLLHGFSGYIGFPTGEVGIFRDFVNVTKTVTVDYTASFSDELIVVDATAGNLTITLPLPYTANGKRFWVKKYDTSANTVTVTTPGGVGGFESQSVSDIVIPGGSRGYLLVEVDAGRQSYWVLNKSF